MKRRRSVYLQGHILSGRGPEQVLYSNDALSLASGSPVVFLRTDTHLLMLRLFFFDPNSPCRNRMGDVRFGLSETGLAGSWRSYTKGTVVIAPEVL